MAEERPTARVVLRRGRDAFGVVLVLTLLILLTAPFELHAIRPVLTAMFAALLVFTLWTTGAARHALRIAGGLGLGAVVVVAVLEMVATDTVRRVAFTAISVVLLVTTIVLVLSKVFTHPRVSLRTVNGALSAYVLVGLAFAYVDVFVAEVRGRAFFAQAGDHSPVAYIYYSFVTLTTVGYGDLTSADDVSRMLSVIEALAGQLYLVTIVSLFVSNMGRRRGSRRRDDDD